MMFRDNNQQLDKSKLSALSSKYGYNLSNQQLDILMYYVKPDNNGLISSNQLMRAADRPERLAENVTVDLRDGVRSVTGTSSVMSNLSDIENPAAQFDNPHSRMGKLKNEMEKTLVDG